MTAIDTLISWLFAATIRGSLLIGGVFCLQLALRRMMPAKWRFALWLPVLFVLTVPILPECKWSGEKWFSRPPAASESCCPTVRLESEPAFDLPRFSETSSAARFGWWVIVGCWFAGAAWFFGVVTNSYLRSMGRLRRDSEPCSQETSQLVEEVGAVMGLKKLPRLLVSPRVGSPAVTGLFRPTLLLPTVFPDGLTREEATLVLRHELLHIRRGDLLINWLLFVLQAVHWFNPVAWFAFGKMRSDCEHARDEDVLAYDGSDCRHAYGNALIKIASSYGGASEPGILCIATSSGSLEARVRAVAGYRGLHRAWSAIWALLVFGVAVAGATRSPIPVLEAGKIGSPDLQAEMSIARRIIVQDFTVNDVSVADAIDRLRAVAEATDPNSKALRIWLTPEGRQSAARKKISLSLQNVSVWQALVEIASRANLGLDGNQKVVCMKWPFAGRTWLVKEEQLHALGFNSSVAPRVWLQNRGVTSPEGSFSRIAPAHVDDSGIQWLSISIRNSPENLQKVALLLGDKTNAATTEP